MNCPKCSAASGDDWAQCGDSCPMPASPHYSPAWTEQCMLPPVPRPKALRRPQRGDGGYDMVPAYSAEELSAFARAAVALNKESP